MKKFTKQTRSRIKNSDIGGHQYFARVFDLALDLVEDFVHETDIGWDVWFQDHLVPIIHCEAKYRQRIIPGQTIDGSLHVGKLKKSSVEFHFEFKQNGKRCASVSTTHIFLSKDGESKAPIPQGVYLILEDFLIKP